MLASFRADESRDATNRPSRFLYNFLAAIIIVYAIFVSAYWSYRVPLFQEPDEVAHADYAFAFFNAGQFFRLQHGVPTNYVTPQIRYLMKVSEYRRLRYNRYGTVSAEYGTRGWRARVDHSAPLPSNRVPREGSTVPYVMSLYPAPYYVLVSAVMSAVWRYSHGSLFSAFIAGRFLNVALLAATLLIALLALEELKFSRLQKLSVLFAAGTLPLSTSMASSIQPDNQSAFIVILCWLLALKVIKEPASWNLVLCLMLAEIALAFTKIHYAAVVSIATALALRDVFRGPRGPRYAILLIVAPIVAILTSIHSLPVQWSGGPKSASVYQVLDAKESAALATRILIGALRDSFGVGNIFDSFWLHFGVRAAHAFSGWPLQWATLALLVGTYTALVALGVTQLSLFRRCLAISRARGIPYITRFFGKDIALNLYVLITFLLFMISVFTGGSVPLQGRYWYPMLIPLIVVIVRAISRLGPSRRIRLAIMNGVCIMWAMYAVCASPSATYAMDHDFYGHIIDKRTSELGELTRVSINGLDVDRFQESKLRPTDALRLEGVSLDATRGLPSTDVRYSIDGGVLHRALVGKHNTELDDIFGDPSLSDAGFSIALTLRSLSHGEHEIHVVTFERGIPRELTIAEYRFKLMPP